eukprot:scaffold338963_cov22-Prasinocladus_malaysianus.AAC.1
MSEAVEPWLTRRCFIYCNWKSLSQSEGVLSAPAQGIKVDNDAMDVPAAAIGVLHFMELTLGEIDFYRSTSCIAAAPVFLKLLSQIAAKHATM